MNNEIKEILDNLKDYELRYKQCNENQFIIFYRDIRLLLDYITNLQQENERLKEENKDNEQLIETQLRGLEKQKKIIEKANEILKNWHQEYNGLMKTNNIYISEDKPSLFDLRGVLNGRSDE